MEIKENSVQHSFQGSIQQNRYSEALEKDYVQIDEMSFKDKLVYMLGLSKMIHFYNTDDTPAGDWSDMLTDEAVILAAISFFDPSQFESRFKTDSYKATIFNDLVKKKLYFLKSLNEIYNLACRINKWYINLKSIEDYINNEVYIRSEICNIIETKLAPSMQKFKSFVAGASEKLVLTQKIEFDFEVFHFIWGLENVETSSYIYDGEDEKDRLNAGVEVFQIIFQELYEASIYLKSKSNDYLEDSLQKDYHYPEIALMLSFLKLYQFPQENLNKLTHRYLNYYFRTILKQSEKPAINDKVFLNFILDKDCSEAYIPRDTRFLAGNDEKGAGIHYAVDYDLFINKAKLCEIYNFFISKRSLSPDDVDLKRINNIYFSEIQVIEWNRKPIFKKHSFYPAFGEEQQGRGDDDRTMNFASIGFAVASPMFNLSEGKREIDVLFEFKSEAYQDLIKMLKSLSKIMNVSFRETIAKCFAEAFEMKVSSTEGWYAIKRYVATLDDQTSSMVIRFDLNAEAPAFIGFDAVLHAGSFKTSFPVLKILMNNLSYLYPFSLLTHAAIEQIKITTKVTGAKNLILYNNVGPIDPNSPFYPFGPVPTLGSYLLIGNNEIFQKQLENLKINIEWLDVPHTTNGFQDLYKEYNMKVDNTSYEVAISILDAGRWKPDTIEKQQFLKLFRTKNQSENAAVEPGSRVDTKTSLNTIDLSLIKQSPNFKGISQPLTYTTMSKRGFLKVELTSPLHAFGHAVYPLILTDITLENSKNSFLKGKTKKILPQPPYTPQIKTISVDYESSAFVALKENANALGADFVLSGEVFHIHPQGFEKIIPSALAGEIYLVPHYDFEGALYLGFKDVKPPQAVSILFEMLDEFTISSEEEPPVTEWAYLANNTWFSLKPASILRDDTNNFLKTGIVIIDLPESINQHNTIFSNECFWIRICVHQNIEVASHILSITAQAVSATLCGNESLYKSGYLDKPLPAYSINRALVNIQGVKNVIQPLPSFHGQSGEKEKPFQARIAERLKHRNRAINCWDFERLTLDNFPQIEKTTCLPGMNSDHLNAPGNVLQVVIPYANSVLNNKEPKASSELLYQIKSFLQDHTSPFTKVEVRNPSYERIRLICAVKFKGTNNYGYFIQQLNEQVNSYISGNLTGTRSQTQMGKVIYCSDVITYLRTLPYVEFITRFSMVQAARDITGNYILLDTAREGEPSSGLKATKPWSVLVPADQHHFTIIVDRKDQNSSQAGIEFLELGQDFIINE